MSLQLRSNSIQEELFLHYWLFGADNVCKDMNDEFWHKELQLESNKCIGNTNINNINNNNNHNNGNNYRMNISPTSTTSTYSPNSGSTMSPNSDTLSQSQSPPQPLQCMRSKLQTIEQQIQIQQQQQNVQSISPFIRDIVCYINDKPSLETIVNDDDNSDIKWICGKVALKTSLVRSICESKEGSRYLQTILDQSNEEVLRDFINKIWSFCGKLCVKSAGHYVIMKLLSICQSRVSLISLYFKFIDEILCLHLTNMINNIYAAQIISYSLHCRNVNIQNYSLYQIIYTLTKYGTTLIHNASTNVCGNRIIQAVIEKSVFNCNLPKKPISIITEYVVNNILMLSNHQYACRVVQAIIKCHAINKDCINQLLYHLPKVCNNSNGNYSIQMCLEYSTLSRRTEFIEEIFFGQNSEVVDYSKQGKYTLPPSDRNDRSDSVDSSGGVISGISSGSGMDYGMISSEDDSIGSNINDSKTYIKPNYEKFLFGQYSSHVCDKAFQLASMSQKMRLIKCLIYSNNGNNNNSINNENDLTDTVMYKLMHHQYGNYVVRNILYHLLKLNNGNGKYLRRIVFNYLLKIQNKLILSQREISFTYAKHILDMIDRHAM